MFLGFTGEAAGWTQAVAQSAIESHTASLTWAPVTAAVKSLVLDLTCVRPLQVFQSAAEFRPKFSSSSTLWRDPNGRRSESFLWTTSRSSWKVRNFILFVFKWIKVRSNKPFRDILNKLLVSFSIPLRRRCPSICQPVLWAQYLRNERREFLQICHIHRTHFWPSHNNSNDSDKTLYKCPVGSNDVKLWHFYIQKVEGQIHCDIMIFFEIFCLELQLIT